MSDYTIIAVADAPNVLRNYPGEIRFLKDSLGTEQTALTYRRMPAETGSKGSYGHRHKEQEEVVYVIKGTLQGKFDDEIKEIAEGMAVRVAPRTVRGFWNEGPEDVELLIISSRIDEEDWEKVEDFWPE
jgi:uncharacterized cupin superfamily protein